jgi:Putative prokaryotic signal transducing protein
MHKDFSIVYSGTIVQADLLKCLLEGAGIYAMLENEFIGMIAPYVSPGGAGAVKVLVAKSDMDQARSIVEDFEESND